MSSEAEQKSQKPWLGQCGKYFLLSLMLSAAVIALCVSAVLLMARLISTSGGWPGKPVAPEEAKILDCSDDNLKAWLFDDGFFWRGYAVLCFGASGPHRIPLRFWRGGTGIHEELDVPAVGGKALHEALSLALQIPPPQTKQGYSGAGWELFSPHGELLRLSVVSDVPRGLTLLYEGGVFLWPGIRPGFQRSIEMSDGKRLLLETVDIQPHVLRIRDFLHDSESNYFVERARPLVKPSPVVLMDKDKGKEAVKFRTSTSAFLDCWGYDVCHTLSKRISHLTRTSLDLHESFQLLHYAAGQLYLPHTDYFDTQYYSKDDGLIRQTRGGLHNRMITVFVYLNTPAAGGHTRFPRALDGRWNYVHDQCTTGLKIQPVRNSAAMFYSQFADGSLDADSIHMGCPPEKGEEKWSMTRWIWNKPSSFTGSLWKFS